MRELRMSGSVRGVPSNGHPYRDPWLPVRIRWTRLLKRVFEIDLEHCPNCGGELKIIAAILKSAVIGSF